MRVGAQVPLHDVGSGGGRRRVRWVGHGLNRGFLFGALAVACKVLPRRLLYAISDHLTSPLVLALLPHLRRVLQANLAPVDPAVTPLRVIRSYARNFLDTMFAARTTATTRCTFEDDAIGTERFRRALATGRGAIVVSPHLGNWDIGCRSLEGRGFRFHVVALREDDPTVEEFRRQVRGGDGRTISAGSALASFFSVRSALERGDLVLMLGDRSRPGDTVAVTLFGRRCAFPRTPAALAQLLGASIVPAAFVRSGDGRFKGLSAEPLPAPERAAGPGAVEETTRQIAAAFEGFIREHPDQWYNFYPFWEVPAA